MRVTLQAPSPARSWVGTLIAVVLLVLTGCDQTVPLLTNALRNPRDVALACVADGKVADLNGCDLNDVRAYVTAGSTGTIAVGKPHVPDWIDNDGSIPGFTPLLVDGLPQKVLTTSLDPSHLFTTLPVRREIARIDLLTGKRDAGVTLPFSPGAVAVVEKRKAMYVVDTVGGGLWKVPMTAFEGKGAPQQLLFSGKPLGGSPHSLAWVDYDFIDGLGASKTRNDLFVGHLEHGHISIVDLATEKLVKRAPIDAQCRDGVDNDGDGTTDSADSGCDDADDPFEGDPEVGAAACGDTIDNDGDGKIDSADLGCTATPTHDSCRDGIDNDGDGKTDYPADPGCSGFAGNNEARDGASCGDGVDNDGDGKTDTDDSKCSAVTDDKEAAAVAKDVNSACNDKIDNDGDGKTDTDDSDCSDAGSGGEIRAPCDDGIDNDGDGLTDTADGDCYNRASPAEVSIALAPSTTLAASFSGRYLLVGHHRRGQLLVFDTQARLFLVPKPGETTPFKRASAVGSKLSPAGIDVGNAPLAIAPILDEGKEAFAVTLQLRGLIAVRLFDTEGKLSIGVVTTDTETKTAAARPRLSVGGNLIDLATTAPPRFASFGPVVPQPTEGDKTNWYGLTMTDTEPEHRTETWRFAYEGLLPGGERKTGRFVASDTFVDHHADFCQLGVVPGDSLIVRRGADAKDCEGLKGDAVRYRIVDVGSDQLKLDKDGVTDVPVTASNQLNVTAADAVSVPLPKLSCVPRGGIHYEVRASDWLVTGSVTGMTTSRRRADVGCVAWDKASVAQAARLVMPRLKSGEELAACPISAESLAASFENRDYATGASKPFAAFANAVFTATLTPGCTGGDDAADAARLLPGVRDMTWSFGVAIGFSPRVSAVGALAVALASHPALPSVYVVDQGKGTLHAVTIADGDPSKSLE